MHEINYSHKPSKTTLKANIIKALNNGKTFIILTWGENQITIDKTPNGLIGRGWIGRNGGDDIANSILMKG
tara:strand:- start:7 stop:219 length:213 start_codon:yes stop_codon:yes gene_type:complete